MFIPEKPAKVTNGNFFGEASCPHGPAQHSPAFRLSGPRSHTRSHLSVHGPQGDLNERNLTVSPSGSKFFKINSLPLGAALKALPPQTSAQTFSRLLPLPPNAIWTLPS